ncbi:MAG TPA: 2-C-methyl-D-erythritol 4-phosphate cytidylyltransferase [Tepidisphaeraceae bacterium]|jgi:2-C-methyl-D-erythritol 4-phosphate cytidylyltransferase|nr:2-C-methyl-D-erythritol 4-phosphate cytidylyltransferase [Tepidisphaeraceae bacterium]
MDTFTVIMPAAGRSLRFGGPQNKLQAILAGRSVLIRSVDAFVNRADVAQVIVATTPPESGETIPPPFVTDDPRIVFVPGGSCRAESVLRALRRMPVDSTWVAVHDAARPLISQELIDRTFAAARRYGAAVPAMPVALTVKQADGPLPAKVQRTLPRATLWAMQTPQIMRRAALLAAYERRPLPLDQITDDVQLLELAGEEVWIVPGEERNLKITTQADLKIAEMFLP